MKELEILNLGYTYPGQTFAALQSVSWKSGERSFALGIAGESGSGKSTLLKAIYGLLDPDDGQILFKGKKITGPSENLIPGHPKMKRIAQDFNLLQDHTVEENIHHRLLAYRKEFRKQKADALLELCGIADHRHKKPALLSGGQQQLLAISCALAEEPELLLLDEPFSHLDRQTQLNVFQYLKNLREQLGFSFIFVSHDAPDVLEICDELIIMKQGKIIETGHPESIYYQPKNTYTAALFGAYNTIGKQIIRPSSVRPTAQGKSKFSGKISQKVFRGETWWVEVKNGRKTISYLSLSEPPMLGKVIHLTWPD